VKRKRPGGGRCSEDEDHERLIIDEKEKDKSPTMIYSVVETTVVALLRSSLLSRNSLYLRPELYRVMR